MSQHLTTMTDTVTGLSVTDLSATNKITWGWKYVPLGGDVSMDISWPSTGTPNGAWSIEFTDIKDPANTDSGQAYDLTTLLPAVTHPAGTSGSVMICLQAPGVFMRLCYTRTSGGTGCVPTVWFSEGT